VLVCIAAAVVLVVVASGVDLLLVNGRIKHVPVTFPTGGTGTTYLILGSDSRGAIPTGIPKGAFGNATAVPGERADVVLIVHTDGSHTSILAVPRDTLVSLTPGTFERVTLALDDGPQAVVDGLCRTLHVAVDHLVIVNFRSFAAIVDELGGITVTLPYPLRDPITGLSLDHAGIVHLDGIEALALVRSRTPQWLVDGRWTTVPDGAVQRTEWSGRVLEAVLHAARAVGYGPVTLQSLAWAASGSLTTDTGTDLATLWDLSRVTAPMHPLPMSSIANTIAVTPNASTFAELSAAGFDGHCTSG
jgi:LCP family protein required for cell wall assembly